ncbi:hypothetical protein HORIV_08000 [Vreelandella olivaria]|uniref:RDD domain-containing protein n=1 Tax=Vreelandella olivaria TaxID=390919 RepID=A0ABM8HK36_9GAMM|nr:hypothetical protein HORIV_08000 [Halomonas olivaria]
MTLGMQAWRLRVQTAEGRSLNLKQCLIRCAVAWLSLLALGLGYLWVLFDQQRRSWPDIASNTQTVVLPKNNFIGHRPFFWKSVASTISYRAPHIY